MGSGPGKSNEGHLRNGRWRAQWLLLAECRGAERSPSLAEQLT
jgi:hypothetical protein